MRTEGDKSIFSSSKFETFANFESKPHIIIIFHLKTNRQKLEKHQVNGSQTRMLICLLNLQILAQNDIFFDFSLFWRPFL